MNSDSDIDDPEEVMDVTESTNNDRRSTKSATPVKKRRIRGELSAREKATLGPKTFQNKWLLDNNFKGWLVKIPDDETHARCSVCNAVIVCGKSELTKHAAGKKHQDKVALLKTTRPIAEVINANREETILKENVKKAEISFTAFFAEHNIALLTADHLIELIKANLKDSPIAQNMTLDRTKCTAILTNVIAKTEQEELAAILRNTFFSILVDETTEIDKKKNMCVLTKYVSPETGRVHTPLLELVQLDATDCSADKLFECFEKTLERHEIPITKILGLECDNANVMIGRNHSFFTLLRDHCPWLVLLKCVCHSSALAARRACATLPPLVDWLLRSLSTYVGGSPKRTAILAEFQEFFEQEVHKLLKPAKTRWLVLHPIVVRTLEQWRPLTEFFVLCSLEDPKDEDAAKILSALRNPFIKGYLLFLKYTLEYFNRLNAMFQSAGVMIHKLCDSSDELLQQICQNFLKAEVLEKIATIQLDDPKYQLELEKVCLGPNVGDLLQGIPVPTDPCGKMTKEQLVNQRNGDIKAFRLRCLKFYLVAAKEIRDRLPSSQPLYKEMRFVDPRIALDGNARSDDLKDLSTLCTQFKDVLQLDDYALACEWRSLPITFNHQKDRLKEMDPENFWMEVAVAKDFSDNLKFPNLTKVARAVMSLPHSNAEAERVFSVVTDRKNKKTNRMCNATLSGICVAKVALQQRKVPCFKYEVTKKHMSRHNSSMYPKKDV